MSGKGKRRAVSPGPTSTPALRRDKRARTAEPSSPPPSAFSTSALPPTPSSNPSGNGRRRRGGSVAPVYKPPKTLLARLAASSKPLLNPLPLPSLPSLSMREQEVRVWGDGSLGQFGLELGELEVKVRPERHEGLSGRRWEAVACGGMHCLALDEEGEVWSWGINDAGALGRVTKQEGASTEELESRPERVQGLDDIRVVRIAAGASISLALGSHGELRAWGSFRSNDGLLGLGPDHRPQVRPVAFPELARVAIAQVACGADHVLALSTSGIVYVWGNGQQNQLGRKVIERRKTAGLTPEKLALKNVVLVGAGAYTSYAVDSFGRCFAWGLNANRQTGVSDDYGGDGVVVAAPTHVVALDPSKRGGARVVSIRGGDHHALFLLDDGTLLACGRCDASQCGIARSHPIRIDARRHIEERVQQREAVRDAETKRMMTNGKSRREAERDATILAAAQVFVPVEAIPEPTRVEMGSEGKVKAIACGPQHSLAVMEDGVRVFGFNATGGLGLGEGVDEVEVPVLIDGLSGVEAVAAGGSCCFSLCSSSCR